MVVSDCWLQNEEILRQLTSFINEIDNNISTYYEVHTNIREEHIEGQLIALLQFTSNEKLQAPLSRISQERERLGLKPISFKFKVSHVTSREKTTGADIGLIAEIDLPGEYQYRKAAIIQSKRLYPNGNGQFYSNSSYQEIFPDKEKVQNGLYVPQWLRMKQITPASYYWLYNPQQIRINNRLRSLGTRVLSAEFVEARFNAVSLPTLTANDAYTYGRSFGSWLIEDFVCCKVGDGRDEVIRAALGQNPDFPVAHTIIFNITSDSVQEGLFGQNPRG